VQPGLDCGIGERKLSWACRDIESADNQLSSAPKGRFYYGRIAVYALEIEPVPVI
jgi:hypothetical protein